MTIDEYRSIPILTQYCGPSEGENDEVVKLIEEKFIKDGLSDKFMFLTEKYIILILDIQIVGYSILIYYDYQILKDLKRYRT